MYRGIIATSLMVGFIAFGGRMAAGHSAPLLSQDDVIRVSTGKTVYVGTVVQNNIVMEAFETGHLRPPESVGLPMTPTGTAMPITFSENTVAFTAPDGAKIILTHTPPQFGTGWTAQVGTEENVLVSVHPQGNTDGDINGT
jgi:hypothetical protein